MAQDGYERSEISGRISYHTGDTWGDVTAAQMQFLTTQCRDWLERQFPGCDVTVDEATGPATIYGSWPDEADAREEIRDAICLEMPTAQWFEMMPGEEA